MSEDGIVRVNKNLNRSRNEKKSKGERKSERKGISCYLTG